MEQTLCCSEQSDNLYPIQEDDNNFEENVIGEEFLAKVKKSNSVHVEIPRNVLQSPEVTG